MWSTEGLRRCRSEQEGQSTKQLPLWLERSREWNQRSSFSSPDKVREKLSLTRPPAGDHCRRQSFFVGASRENGGVGLLALPLLSWAAPRELVQNLKALLVC